jgi:hypothetical protein
MFLSRFHLFVQFSASQTVERDSQGGDVNPLGGAICLYEEHICFERNMGAIL